jgi:hypothetical protein
MERDASSTSSSSGYHLILPDLSGIAKIVDDYSLPTFDTSLRDIVSAHDRYNKLTQQLVGQVLDDHEKMREHVKSNQRLIDHLIDEQAQFRKQVEVLSSRLDSLTETVKSLSTTAPTNATTSTVDRPENEQELVINTEAIPAETYDPSDNLDKADESNAPGIYYTVNPHYGENSIEGEGRVVIKGRHVKLAGKLTIVNKEDASLNFDSLKEYQAVKVESAKISYYDRTIETIEVDDINRGMVELKLGEIDSSFFPLELSYRIKYLTKRN